jgi:putative transposase
VKKSRFSEEKIIAVLKQAEAGVKVSELVRKLGISEATFYIYGLLPKRKTHMRPSGRLRVSSRRNIVACLENHCGKRAGDEIASADCRGFLDLRWRLWPGRR